MYFWGSWSPTSILERNFQGGYNNNEKKRPSKNAL